VYICVPVKHVCWLAVYLAFDEMSLYHSWLLLHSID
jgi:hypothetical protein